MKKVAIRIFSIIFTIVLIGCVLFGQTIKNRNIPQVQFEHAKSGSLSWTYRLVGEFIWKRTEDIVLKDAQTYALVVTELPISAGDYLDNDTTVIRGVVSSQYDRDCMRIEDDMRRFAFNIELLQYEQTAQNQDDKLVKQKKEFFISEYSLLSSRLEELVELKKRLETVVNKEYGYLVQYYLTEGDIYSGTNAAYCISLDEKPLIRFVLPDTVEINQYNSIQFFCAEDQTYLCTISELYEDKGIRYAEAIPEEKFWINNAVDDVMFRSVYADYLMHSERYQTLLPSKAIHIGEDGAYVYLALSEQGYWSEDYVVKRMPVTVLAQSNIYTAILERILGSENIIISDEFMSFNEGEYVMESLP